MGLLFRLHHHPATPLHPLAAPLISSPDHVEGHEITCKAQVEHLPTLLNYLQRVGEEAGVDSDVMAALHLAVEEACVNIIRHGYAEDSPGPIRLSCRVLEDRVEVSVTDEAPPFDPASVSAPDLTSGWEDRPVGGLGWHLIRQSVDEIHHEVTPRGGNQLTLVKKLPHSAHSHRSGPL